MNEKIHHVLQQRTEDLAFRAICLGDPLAMKQLQNKGSKERFNETYAKIVRERKEVSPNEGFTLPLYVSEELAQSIIEAEGDNAVYDNLGEHFILGKSKKKKKKKKKRY
jgi:hypothetical protein